MGLTVVVGAAIVRDGRLLAACRVTPARLAGRWELPGGKVEPGEDDRSALVREIDEELGVRIAVGAPIGADTRLGPSSVLRVFNATLLAGEPGPRQAHSAVRWLTRDEVADLDWLDADLPVVRLLAPDLVMGTAGPLAGTGHPVRGSDGVSDRSSDGRSWGIPHGGAGPPPRPDAPGQHRPERA